MIIIDLKELILIIPELTNLFLSGFIFISVYNWLNNKKSDISVLTLGSLFISVLIQALLSSLHQFILCEVIFSEPSKIIIYAITGFISAIICSWARNTKAVGDILYAVSKKSINDDVLKDVIDYDKKTMMIIYLKGSDVYYIGSFLYREENGLDSWICLINYGCYDKETDSVVFDPDEENKKSTVLLNLRDIERIHLIYEDNTNLWNKFYKFN